MGAEDEAFLNRIKLDLCAAREVLHNWKENAVVAETVWPNSCVYLQISFGCQLETSLGK
jgi:hypothetical protein